MTEVRPMTDLGLASARAEVSAAVQRLIGDLARGGTPVAVCERYAEAVLAMLQQWVAPAFAAAQDRTLVAIGGLGRGALGPHSDLDLVVLCSEAPPEGDAAFEAWIQSIVHPLWDLRLRANVGTHDISSWMAGAREDLTLCTALLDVRYVAGSRSLLQDLEQRARAEFFADAREDFIARLEAEVHERHRGFGSTVYLVEPDLKQGPGGLRDLAVVEWCLAATYATRDWSALADDARIGPRVAGIMASARATLLRLRAALQIASGRAQDRLTFQYQERMPALLGLLPSSESDDRALVAAIEHFMQSYYAAARDILRYGPRICEQCRPARANPEQELRIDERFAIRGGKLIHQGGDPFADTPVLALEALALARDHNVELAGSTFDGIAECMGLPGATALASEPEARRRMLDLLSAPNDVGIPSALELASELGLLGRMVPEYAAVRGRMQHEGYHVYTVDQHTLNAIAFLKSLARGEHRKDYPLATALHLDLEDPRTLYVSMLAHDLGKAEDGDQCVEGAKLARQLAERLGLSVSQSERCALLVREHLAMPLLSQKRDLGDPLLIADFAKRIGDRQALRELYLLSLADMAQVRPGFLTSWKLTLLDELYLATAAALRADKRPPRPRRPRRSGEPVGLPDRYYTLYDVDMRRHHRRAIDALLISGRHAAIELVQGTGALRLTVVARNRPALLAQMSAMFDDHDFEVLAADVFSIPGKVTMALDVFRIEPRRPAAFELASIATAMEDELERGWATEAVTAEPPRLRTLGFERRRAATTVTFAEDPGGARTIVEVGTPDQPGVLRRITLAFAAEGIDIDLARCSTVAGGVDDIFYVPRLDSQARTQLAERLQRYLRRG